jgi:hypothetical protein
MGIVGCFQGTKSSGRSFEHLCQGIKGIVYGLEEGQNLTFLTALSARLGVCGDLRGFERI